jgi:hypothetical protein
VGRGKKYFRSASISIKLLANFSPTKADDLCRELLAEPRLGRLSRLYVAGLNLILTHSQVRLSVARSS